MSDEPHRDQAESPTSSPRNRPDSDAELDGDDAIVVTAGTTKEDEIIPGDPGPILENKMASMTPLPRDRFSFYYMPVPPRSADDQRKMVEALQLASRDTEPISKDLAKGVLVTCDGSKNCSSIKVGGLAIFSFTFTNWSDRNQTVVVKNCNEPFSIECQSVMLHSGAEEDIVVKFQANEVRYYEDEIIFEVEETGEKIIVKVSGECKSQ